MGLDPRASYSELWNIVTTAFNEGKLIYRPSPFKANPVPTVSTPTPQPGPAVELKGGTDTHINVGDKHLNGRSEPRSEPKSELKSEPKSEPKKDDIHIEPRIPG